MPANAAPDLRNELELCCCSLHHCCGAKGLVWGLFSFVLRSMGRELQGEQEIYEELVEKESLWLIIFDQEL